MGMGGRVLQVEDLRMEPDRDAVLLTEGNELGRVFVIRSQRQIHCRFVDYSVPKKIGQTRKSAAAHQAGGFEFLGSAPIIVHKTDNLVSQLRMLRDLLGEIDGAIVCAHNK